MVFQLRHIAILAVLAVSTSAQAGKDDEAISRPQVYQDVVACRTITDQQARLACFDKAAASLEQSVDGKDLVMLDRAEINKARHSLFGFSLPDLPYFKDQDEEKEPALSRIETTFQAVSSIGLGKWQFVLPEAGTWQTTEAVKFSLKAGQKVLVKKSAGGGYMMQVGSSGYIRVKRVG